MMGDLCARVPLQNHLSPNLPIEKFIPDIENQFVSIIGLEHCAMKALRTQGESQNRLKQAVSS